MNNYSLGSTQIYHASSQSQTHTLDSIAQFTDQKWTKLNEVKTICEINELGKVCCICSFQFLITLYIYWLSFCILIKGVLRHNNWYYQKIQSLKIWMVLWDFPGLQNT